MQLLSATFAGAIAGVVAVLLHQSLPPFGVALSIVTTYLSIWWVGRHFGARRFKALALIGWLAVIFRATTYGVGNELLVQGDGVGSALLIIGTLTALGAVGARI